jgi:hypothetical protein
MAEPDKKPVTLEELLVSSLAQTDALAKLLIEKGLITREEFMANISEERATYQKLLNPIPPIWESSNLLRMIPVVIGLMMLVRWASGKGTVHAAGLAAALGRG